MIEALNIRCAHVQYGLFSGLHSLYAPLIELNMLIGQLIIKPCINVIMMYCFSSGQINNKVQKLKICKKPNSQTIDYANKSLQRMCGGYSGFNRVTEHTQLNTNSFCSLKLGQQMDLMICSAFLTACHYCQILFELKTH